MSYLVKDATVYCCIFLSHQNSVFKFFLTIIYTIGNFERWGSIGLTWLITVFFWREFLSDPNLWDIFIAVQLVLYDSTDTV